MAYVHNSGTAKVRVGEERLMIDARAQHDEGWYVARGGGDRAVGWWIVRVGHAHQVRAGRHWADLAAAMGATRETGVLWTTVVHDVAVDVCVVLGHDRGHELNGHVGGRHHGGHVHRRVGRVELAGEAVEREIPGGEAITPSWGAE